MRIFCIAILTVLIAACTPTVTTYAAIDQAEKTITVPTGGAGLAGQIKQRLTDAGWQMMVDRGPGVITGTADERVNLQVADTFNTRYRLVVSSRQVDICLNLTPQISYNLSLIDNQTGTEVITMGGVGCQRNIVDSFMEELSR